MHQVGVGVLGPVFRTYDPDRDRLVAVKAFQLDLVPEQIEVFVGALKRVVEVGPRMLVLSRRLEPALRKVFLILHRNMLQPSPLIW